MLSGLLVKLKTLLDKRDAQLKELKEQSEADDIVQVLTNDGVKQTGSGSVGGNVCPPVNSSCGSLVDVCA